MVTARTAACPRGCGFSGRPNHVGRHVTTCLRPRTIERLAEIGQAVRDGDCLLWHGQAERYGEAGRRRAHVIALEIALGRPLAAGEQACHHCDRPGCISPEHLYAGDYRSNGADMARRGRTRGAAKWTREQRLAAGLNGAKARAASRLARLARARCGHLMPRSKATCVRLLGHAGHCRAGRLG